MSDYIEIHTQYYETVSPSEYQSYLKKYYSMINAIPRGPEHLDLMNERPLVFGGLNPSSCEKSLIELGRKIHAKNNT